LIYIVRLHDEFYKAKIYFTLSRGRLAKKTVGKSNHVRVFELMFCLPLSYWLLATG
jgi:hypothetical protein